MPEQRAWPGRKCERCVRYSYTCSANRTAAEETSIIQPKALDSAPADTSSNHNHEEPDRIDLTHSSASDSALHEDDSSQAYPSSVDWDFSDSSDAGQNDSDVEENSETL